MLATLIAYGILLGIAAVLATIDVPHQACPAGETLVLVDTRSRVLSLCRAGREERSFRVALGRGGVDKRTEGDGRTPVGRYALGPARPSRRYHLFLPVAYPTAEQVSQGYSGSDIGIHGPHLAFAWLGHATVSSDWTLGCVAVATRGEIEEIAAWVEEANAAEIVFLGRAIPSAMKPVRDASDSREEVIGALRVNRGLGDDRTTGIEWLETAVASGHIAAGYHLATVLENGARDRGPIESVGPSNPRG